MNAKKEVKNFFITFIPLSIIAIVVMFFMGVFDKTPGCMDPNSFNYNPEATKDDGSCIPIIYGCTESDAFNYNADANTNDDTCCTISGCTNSEAINYAPDACFNDETCNFGIFEGEWKDVDNIAGVNVAVHLKTKLDGTFTIKMGGLLSTDFTGKYEKIGNDEIRFKIKFSDGSGGDTWWSAKLKYQSVFLYMDGEFFVSAKPTEYK